jgi:hypothetical protein
MFDTLLLRPSLHSNTPLHFTTLHSTTLPTLRNTTPHSCKTIKWMNEWEKHKNIICRRKEEVIISKADDNDYDNIHKYAWCT